MHVGPSDAQTFVFLTDTMCKSLHGLSYCFCLFLQREEEQFRVSLLAVHLIKVVRGASGMFWFCCVA